MKVFEFEVYVNHEGNVLEIEYAKVVVLSEQGASIENE